MTYLLDADVFIRAKNQHYGFEFCPAFWKWLEQANAESMLFSTEAVYRELAPSGDDLAKWVQVHQKMFLTLTADELPAVAAMNRWANDSRDYNAAAKAEFASAADSFLIAHALAGDHTVVTHERISDGRSRIKIPNAALANGVKVMDPFSMLRTEQVRFVLG